jgi:Holliday junction resolvasome RuvABC ATP-dependent DNA helicase subunit
MHGLGKIIGQTAIVSRLRALKDFFAEKQAPPGHFLLIGPDGMGKRTIALAFAEEFGSTVKVALGRSMERKGDLTAILTSLEAPRVPSHRGDWPTSPTTKGNTRTSA